MRLRSHSMFVNNADVGDERGLIRESYNDGWLRRVRESRKLLRYL